MKAIGPQVSGDARLPIAQAGIGSMRVTHGLGDRTALSADSDQVNMVAHQAVGPDRHAELLGEAIEHVEVGAAIFIRAENALAMIAAVCQMKGPPFEHDPRKSCHLGSVVSRERRGADGNMK